MPRRNFIFISVVYASIFLSPAIAPLLAAGGSGWGTVTQVRGKASLVPTLEEASSAKQANHETIQAGFILRDNAIIKLEAGSEIEIIPCSGREVMTFQESGVLSFDGCSGGISMASLQSYKKNHERVTYGSAGGQKDGSKRIVLIRFPRGVYLSPKVEARWQVEAAASQEVIIKKISIFEFNSKEPLWERELDAPTGESKEGSVELPPLAYEAGGYYVFVVEFTLNGKASTAKEVFSFADEDQQKILAEELEAIAQQGDIPAKARDLQKLLLYDRHELYYEASKLHGEVFGKEGSP